MRLPRTAFRRHVGEGREVRQKISESQVKGREELAISAVPARMYYVFPKRRPPKTALSGEATAVEKTRKDTVAGRKACRQAAGASSMLRDLSRR